MLAAALLVSSVTAAGKLVGLAKELALAHRFGTGDTLDAFLLACVIPTFLVTTLAGPLVPAFLPLYLERRVREDDSAAGALFRSTLVGSLVLLASLTALAAVATPLVLPYLASGFSPEKIELTQRLSKVVLPIVVLNAGVSLWTALLNAHDRYRLAALSPAVVPAGILLGLLLGGDRWGILAVAAGLLGGTVLQVGVLVWGGSRLGVRLSGPVRSYRADWRQLCAQYLPAVGGACLMSGTVLVDQAMAAMLPGGSVATLNYANKIPALLVGFGTIGIGTAVLPHYGRLSAHADWRGIRRSLRATSAAVLAAGVPITLAMIAGSQLIIRTVYQRGAFRPEDTLAVAATQALLLIQVPFHLVGMIYVRLASALKRNAILFWGATISLPLNAILNYVFMQRWGVAGIALSTSVVYMVACGYMVLATARALRQAGTVPGAPE